MIEYPTLYPSDDVPYVARRVKVEAGARSALDPSLTCTVTAYVGKDLRDWSFSVDGIRVITPERTYLEKLLILHGVHCGYRDAERRPAEKGRVSRRYYDVAMITTTDTGRAALSNADLLDAVRSHNLTMFRQAWKRFEEAVPGSVRLVPQPELRAVVERDYRAMEGIVTDHAKLHRYWSVQFSMALIGMILGEALEFGWVSVGLWSSFNVRKLRSMECDGVGRPLK